MSIDVYKTAILGFQDDFNCVFNLRSKWQIYLDF